MKSSTSVAVLLSLGLASGVQAGDLSCDIDSDYDLRRHGRAFVFERQDGDGPKNLALGGGRVWVDGVEAKLSAADHARMRAFEGELNRLLPEVQQVATEAVDIAFTALTEVARGFGAKPEAVTRMERARERLGTDMLDSEGWLFSSNGRRYEAGAEAMVESFVEPLVAELVPELVGSAVASSLKVAFSFDETRISEFEQRMERMGEQIEARVEKRADALEARADALCVRARRLDGIERALDYWLADGGRLDLLRADVDRDDDEDREKR